MTQRRSGTHRACGDPWQKAGETVGEMRLGQRPENEAGPAVKGQRRGLQEGGWGWHQVRVPRAEKLLW